MWEISNEMHQIKIIEVSQTPQPPQKFNSGFVKNNLNYIRDNSGSRSYIILIKQNEL